MHLSQVKISLATLIVATTWGLAAPAFADGKNEVRAVTFDEDAGITRVHVRAAQTPTFTVYKLERPSRVVIDLPQASLAEAVRGAHELATTLTAGTWAVGTIAAQEIDDGGSVVRVIVTLARPGRYDVKTDGNELVVMVMPRDPKPASASPADLAAAQAQAEAARHAQADAERANATAQAEATKAKSAAATAQAEAERLRKAATEQAARAETAQRAAEQAKKTGDQNAVSLAEVERAKAQAAAANANAMKAKDAAALAQAESDRARNAADQARREAIAQANAAKAEAAAAKDDAARTRAEAAAAAATAKDDAARTRAEAAAAKDDAAHTRAEAAAAKDDAARTRAEATAAKNDATRTRAEAAAAAAAAKEDAARTHAEAIAAKNDAARTHAEAEQAKRDAAAAQAQVAAAVDETARSRADAAAARSEMQQARSEAQQARNDADAARADAQRAATAAAADKRQAETERAAAEHMLKDAKTQLASLDQRTATAQEMQDRARAASAAAEAREQAARTAVASAAADRQAAEAAAKRAADARDQSSTQAKSERDRLSAEAKSAELRLADAKHQADAAEARRVEAETAAGNAKRELEHSKTALATVEQQRGAAEIAASDAARKRSEAEAAAGDAARRRGEAETAAQAAARKRSEAETAAADAAQRRSEADAQRIAAEQQRKSAEDAAQTARAAATAADKQRAIAEASAKAALGATHSAEASLATLTAKRDAAEHAAQQLEARSKAEAAAQAEVAAAKARKATEDELGRARAEASRLVAERKAAEDELTARRKAVAAQQAEADRLKTAATEARDAADREENRRAQLAEQRVAEEHELARVKAQKIAAAAVVVAPIAAPIAAPVKPTPAAPALAVATPTPAPIASGTKAIVKSIDFRGDNGNGEIDIAMTGTGSVQVGEVTATYAELIIDNAELAAKLERKLDVSKFGSPVRAVSSFRDRRTPNRVRLIAELTEAAAPTFDRNGDTVRWSFVGTDRTAAATEHHAARTQDIQPTVVGGWGAASTPVTQQSVTQVPPANTLVNGRRRVYHGATVDLDYKDAPIHDLLRSLAEVGHVNIVVPDDLDAKVTVRLKHVPWDQALEVILASHGWWYRRDGNLYRISTRKQLDSEDEAENARREAMIKAEAPEPEIITLNYASAEGLKDKLEPLLSPKGKIEVDARTNSLIVNDVRGNRQRVSALALSLDTQTPQISIEARVVEANSTFSRQFGIQWGGNALAGAGGGNATGLLFPSTVALTGANSDTTTNSTGVGTPSNFAINLPAATGNGEGGALGMSLGSIAGNFNINLRLSALEDSGTVRIISAPKITVLNGIEAKISQGVSIPIQVLSAAGTNTQFVQADLSLTVKPYVSQRDCAIAMNLIVTKNEPDFANTGARGDPTILRKEAKTTMLVADGDTTVLGGIYTRNTSLSLKKFPFLGDLPVIGWLFKNRAEQDNRTEVLVFITPKITNKASLHCQ